MNKLIGTILIERTFDLICYLALVFGTILIQVNHVSNFVKQKFAEMAYNNRRFPIGLKLFVAVLVFLLLLIILRWLFKKYAHHRYIINIKGFHIGLREGFNSIRYLKKRRWFLFHTVFIWSMYLLQIYIGFSALSATSHLGIIEACSVLSLASLAMIVSPGGIGAFPLAVQQVLLIYNVDNISFGWMIWGVSTAIIIVIGLLSFGLLVHQNKNLNEAKPTDIN